MILIARPRSGTTALRGILHRHPQITSLGEVFHEDLREHPHSFFRYFLQRSTADPSIALPSASNRIALLNGFVDYLAATLHEAQSDEGKDWFVLGVNYNSLHNLNTYWQNFFEAPYLLNIVKWKGYFVIHLIRRNVLQATVSEMRARASGVWHIKATEERPTAADTKLTIDARDFVRQLRARVLEIDLIERAMSQYKQCLTLEYERFFDPDGQPVEEEIQKIAAFLKLASPILPAADYRKTGSTHLRDTVENFDEVAEALVGTQFQRML